jgi:hypothetical protein
MLRRLFVLTMGCLAAICVSAASAAPPDAGESEFIGQTIALFTNGGAGYGNGAYYDTNNSQTDYVFTAGIGFGLSYDFETGFSIGYGQLSANGCGPQICNNSSISDRQWSLFIRHNFDTIYADSNYAFSGLELSAVYPDSGYGRITLVRPYVGYRFGLPQDWALELVVGGSQVVSGSAAVSSGYEVRLGLAIPLSGF